MEAAEQRYWFQEPSKYGQIISRLDIPENEYLFLINLVTETFPPKWVKANEHKLEKVPGVFVLQIELWPPLWRPLPYNPVLQLIGGRTVGGFWPFISLIRLGQLLRIANMLPNKKELLQRLRGDPENYISALFELEVFETFTKAGFSPKDRPEVHGVDYAFQKGDRVAFIEVTHRGCSWIMDLWSKIGMSLSAWPGEKGGKFVTHICINYKTAKRYNDQFGTDKLGWDIDRALAKIRSAADSIGDPQCRFQIEAVESKESGLEMDWYKGAESEVLYETTELFKRRLNDKRDQLSRNKFSFCAVDLRSLIPIAIASGVKENSRRVSAYLEGTISVARAFLSYTPTVGGIFIWTKHAERDKDLIVDQLDQNEIVLIAAKSRDSETELKDLFPFAKFPQELDWYCGECLS